MKKNCFLEIKQALNDYKIEANVIVANYRVEDTKAKTTYQNAIYAQEHEKIVEKYRGKLNYQRDIVTNIINRNINDLQDRLKAWVNTPVPGNQLQLLMALRTAGVTLTPGEITALSENLGGNYFAGRLISEIAGEDVKNPLDEYLKFVKDARDTADFFLRNYAGDTSPLAPELLESQVATKALCISAAARDWEKPTSPLAIAALCWPGGMPGEQIKPLDPENSADKAIADALDALVGPLKPDGVASRIRQLLEKYPLLRPLLLASKYKGFLTFPPDAA